MESTGKRSTKPAWPKKNVSAKTVTDMVGATVGAGLGLWIAGPAGTLVGAAAGPWLTRISELAASRTTAFWQSLRQGIIDRGMSEAEWVEEVVAVPPAEDAVLEIIAAAGRTLDVRRLTALGELASRIPGLDSAEMQSITYFANVLSALSQIHFTTLNTISSLWAGRANTLGVQPDELLCAMGSEKVMVRSILRTLELHGLVVDNSRLFRDHVGVFWEITELGRTFLALNPFSHSDR